MLVFTEYVCKMNQSFSPYECAFSFFKKMREESDDATSSMLASSQCNVMNDHDWSLDLGENIIEDGYLSDQVVQIKPLSIEDDDRRSSAQQKESLVDALYIGKEFDTYEEAYGFYNSYAKLKGFGIRKGHTYWSKKKDTIISRTYVCNKEGFKNIKDRRQDGEDVHPLADTRVGCKARMVISLDRSSEKWRVRTSDDEYN